MWTQELVRKDFEDALTSGRCRGKEQSVVGRDKGFRRSDVWEEAGTGGNGAPQANKVLVCL